MHVRERSESQPPPRPYLILILMIPIFNSGIKMPRKTCCFLRPALNLSLEFYENFIAFGVTHSAHQEQKLGTNILFCQFEQ